MDKKQIIVDVLKAKHVKSGGNCGITLVKLNRSTKIDLNELKTLINALCLEKLITFHPGAQGMLFKYRKH